MEGGLKISLLLLVCLIARSSFAQIAPVFRNPSLRLAYIEEGQRNVPLRATLQTTSPAVTVDLSVSNPNDEMFMYALSGAGSDRFAIVDGVLEVGDTALDRENPNEQTFQFHVRVMYNDAVSSSIDVMVTVLDVNDNPPAWSNQPSGSLISINEQALLDGYTIIVLDVTDPDEGTNSVLSYEIISPPTDANRFDVNPFGRVFLRRDIDYIVGTTRYPITVRVSDGGNPVLFDDLEFMLEVENSLELPPRFDQPVYTATLPEGTYDDPEPIVQVRASNNPFGGSDNPIRYSLLDGITGFSINQMTGQITFIGTLDREIQPNIRLTVTAVEVANNDESIQTSRMAYVRVQVSLTDINDNSPIFFNNYDLSNNQLDIPYEATLSEGATIGTIVVNDVQAFDPDEGSNAEFIYEIVERTGTNLPFAIDSVTGIITLSSPLDYETVQMYAFNIRVVESAMRSNSGTATVIVRVTNINDNSPLFSSSVYQISVIESTPPQTLLTVINATDADLGDYGNVNQYRLIGADNDNPFEISPLGQIFLVGGLDRETRQSYHFTVRAMDVGGLSASTLFVVGITDANDNPPVFVPDMFTAVLTEGIDYSDFLRVFANDQDEADTPNSELSFSIAPTTNFAIDSATGTINAFGLDCETTRSHTLTVTAVDAGDPQLTGTATLTVNLQCTNDHSPRFMPTAYSATLLESHTVGTSVNLNSPISATDLEMGHSIFYSISDSFDDGAFFSIDEVTGVLSLAHSLDADPPNGHNNLMFTVLARDDAEPPLTGSATVQITVTNVNDNAPIITNPPARDPVSMTIQEVVGSSDFTYPYSLLTVDASDNDGDSITYSLSDTTSDHFSITTIGIVMHDSALDRETRNTELFTINACDAGGMCDSVTMTITVSDYNDHTPMFTDAPYTGTISECIALRRASVFQATAVEETDLGQNRAFIFQLVSGDMFSIDQSTGVVSTEGAGFDYDQGMRMFTGMLRVVDNPTGSPMLSSTTSFTVTLTDCNDNPPEFGSGGSYTIRITEGATTSSNPVYDEITVSDNDATAIFQDVSYVILGGTAMTNNWIGIDSSSGELNILDQQTIDREDDFLLIDDDGNGRMMFSIIATNTEPGQFGSTLSAQADVTVIIEDINDNDPMFQNMDPVEVSVVENAIDGSIVAVLTATDADVGTNAHIRYQITAGNDLGAFELNADTGHLTVYNQTLLDRETTPTFRLTAMVENDQATGSTPDTITIDITLTGTNDHSPIFEPPQYNVTLMEYDSLNRISQVSSGSTIVTVSATDGDGTDTPAGQIEYRILSGNFLGGLQVFDISNPSQGAVELLRPDQLDYESRRQWDIVIEAYDLVSPLTERRRASTHLIITLTDANDNIPVFSSRTYSAIFPETDELNIEAVFVPTISVTDRDADGNDPIVLTLTTGTPFFMRSNGIIINTQTIDYDRGVTSYSTTIVATDPAGNTASAQIEISITDVNDNPPVLLNTNRIIRIPLDFVGVFSRIDAIDPDIGVSSGLSYSLSSIQDRLRIDPVTGDLSIAPGADRLLEGTFTVDVSVRDGVHTTSATYTAEVGGENDDIPQFTQTLWLGTLTENLPTGTIVTSQDSTLLQLDGIDEDPDTVLTYSLRLDELGRNLPFNVTSNGMVINNRQVDREVQERYIFYVEIFDGSRYSDIDAAVVVTIEDVNDERPQFEQPSYTVFVYNQTAANEILLIVRATDGDEGLGGEVQYSIISDQTSNGIEFAVNMNSGELFSMEIVNTLSLPSSLTLRVQASDRGTPSSSAQVDVRINFLAMDAAAPIFSSVLYQFAVNDDALDGVIGSVVAASPDPVSYDILPGSGDGSIVIDPQTGELRFVTDQAGRRRKRNVQAPSRQSFHTVTVRATSIGSGSIVRNGYTTVAIPICDVNNNDPYFVPNTYLGYVTENVPRGVTVTQVMAFDDDSTAITQLSYSLLSQNPPTPEAFQITEEGVVVSQIEFDREQVPQYTLTVQAIDGSMNARSSTATITVFIRDVDDNPTQFTFDFSTPVNVSEDAQLGQVITTIGTVDPDEGLNGQPGFYFIDRDETFGPFMISLSGVVLLTGELDREAQDFYELPVVAYEQRGYMSNSRMISGTLRVQILDVNDNPPSFINPYIQFSVEENHPLNTPFATLRATDVDIDENAVIFYHILADNVNETSNSSCVEHFCIDLYNGEISLQGILDREMADSHLITLAASNFLSLDIIYNTSEGSLPAPNLASIGRVEVTVLDINDNPPEFVQSSLFAAIAEEAGFGATVTVLMATDPDTGNGSIAWFEIISDQAPYVVDTDTGALTVAGDFNGLSGTIHEVRVRTFDNFRQIPSFFTDGTVLVQVFKETEQVIASFGFEKDFIEPKVNRIQAAIEAVTGARLIITEVRVQQLDNGEVDVAGTDILFFSLDPVGGNIINPFIIVSTIDENYAAVNDIFTECRVIRIRVFPGQDTLAATIPVWLWIIIGVLSAAIIFLCCCFLIGCIAERRRSRRYKKKASQQQQSEQYTQLDFSNPIWMSPYEGLGHTVSSVSEGSTQENSNPLYESQELTIEMFQDDADDEVEHRKKEKPAKPVKAPPLSIPAPRMRRSGDGMYDSQEIEIHYDVDDDLDGPSDTDSQTQLVRSSTPMEGGLAGKRGGRSKAYYSNNDDDLLDEAVGGGGKSYI